MNRCLVWLFDPLHRFHARRWAYSWLAVFFVRLAIWYHLEDRRRRSR